MKNKIILLILILYSIVISIGALYLLLHNNENTSLIKNYNLLEKCYKNVKLKSEISLQINCINYNRIQNKCEEGLYLNKTKFNYQSELEKCYELYK